MVFAPIRRHAHLRFNERAERGALQLGAAVGLAGCLVVLAIGAIWGQGDPLVALVAYIDIPSIFVTIGGTTMVFVAAYTKSEYTGIVASMKRVLFYEPPDPTSVIPTIVSLSEKARREGLLALEDNVEEITDPFMRRGLQLVIDGTDPELIKTILRIRLSKLEEANNAEIGVFNMLEVRAPAFGLIGTILGLVQLLRNLSDPSTLGPALAVALITTFYGVIIANAICGPIQTKLQGFADNDMLCRNLMLEGILSIQSGDNPMIVEEKLIAYLGADQVKNYTPRTRGGDGKG